MILKELMKAVVAKYGSKRVELGQTWQYPYTFAEVDARVNRLANALIDMGIGQGERLAILSRNCPQYREVYLVSSKAGVVVVPFNYRLSKSELDHMIGDCTPTVMVAPPDYAEIIKATCTAQTSIKHIIWLGKGQGGGIDYESLISKYPANEPSVAISEDALALIQYTSGTTGKAKGAMLTQKNVYAGTHAKMATMASCQPDTVYLGTWPLQGSAGCFNDLSHFLSGASIVTCEHFEASEALSDIEKYHVTSIHMVPTMLKFLIEDATFNRTDISSLKVVNYGSGAISVELLQRVMRAIPHAIFEQFYGSTETVEIATLTKEDHRQLNAKGLKRLGSLGRPFPGVQVRIVDDDDRELPRGETGEIIAKSDSVMRGYWGLPQASDEALRGGWYHTGDIGFMDEDSYLYLLGRKDYMIKSGGYNIYPAEVENIIASHPAVSEVAVIGIPDPDWIESVKAVVVLKEGKTVSETEIIQLCKDNLASYKKPKSVEFVATLPKNAMGKVVKGELRQKYWPAKEK